MTGDVITDRFTWVVTDEDFQRSPLLYPSQALKISSNDGLEDFISPVPPKGRPTAFRAVYGIDPPIKIVPSKGFLRVTSSMNC
jgi:hypothetical protein